MMVVLYFSTLVAICAFIGWGIHGLLAQNKYTPPGAILAIGYAVGVSLFFIAYFIFTSANRATICVLVTATGINIIYAFRIYKGSKKTLEFNKNNMTVQPYLLFVFVTLFSAMTYISSGLGGYWQTANEDVFDALNGRNAYINGEIYSTNTEIDVASRIRGGLDATLKTQSGITPLMDSAFFKNRYVYDLGRLQYSSLAFISELLWLPKGMDVFFLQALLNLGLFALGVLAFVTKVLRQSQSVSIVIALMASFGNFYLATYFNGHEGSLMYNAVVPFVFYFLVIWIRDDQPVDRTLLIPALLLMMVVGAYPYPLLYLFASVILYFILKRMFPNISEEFLSVNGFQKCRNIILAFVFISLFGFLVAYILAEPMRTRALGQFRLSLIHI